MIAPPKEVTENAVVDDFDIGEEEIAIEHRYFPCYLIPQMNGCMGIVVILKILSKIKKTNNSFWFTGFLDNILRITTMPMHPCTHSLSNHFILMKG